MAKKKAVPAKGERPRIVNAVVLRAAGGPQGPWTTWLNAWAADLGMPATVLIDQALREKAKRDGRGVPPSRTQAGREK